MSPTRGKKKGWKILPGGGEEALAHSTGDFLVLRKKGKFFRKRTRATSLYGGGKKVRSLLEGAQR